MRNIHVSSTCGDEGQHGKLAFVLTAGNLRFSLGLRYARFDALDFCSTETRGGTLVLGTRDTLRPNGTLDVGDGGACGGLSFAGLGSHGWYEGRY